MKTVLLIDMKLFPKLARRLGLTVIVENCHPKGARLQSFHGQEEIMVSVRSDENLHFHRTSNTLEMVKCLQNSYLLSVDEEYILPN